MPKTVMIVDDNVLNMKLMCDLLGAAGFDTLQADNGTAASELVKAKKPDLILMDIQLPDDSGLDVTRWLKADDTLKSIPIIAVTDVRLPRSTRNACSRPAATPISPSPSPSSSVSNWRQGHRRLERFLT